MRRKERGAALQERNIQQKLKCISYTTYHELKTFPLKHEHAGFTAMAAAEELYNT